MIAPPTTRAVARTLAERARRAPLVFALVCLLAAAGASTAAAATGATGTAGATGSTGATGTGSTGATGTGSTGATGTPAANASLSSNWAGYAVHAAHGVVRHFTRVIGSWVQPAVTCKSGSRGYSAFWVGLGGLSKSSRALEQTGTEADCDANGGAHYTAWYELVPAGPVTIGLSIAPGDSITAAVSIAGREVTMSLHDLTSGASVTKRIPFAHPDTSSAEWIAEAPSSCNGNACRPLPLSDFGSVSFTSAAASLRDGRSGTVASPLWRTRPIELDELPRGSFQGVMLTPRQVVTASPTALTATGDSFSVSWARQRTAGGSGLLPGVGP